MENFLGTYAPQAYALTRIVFGLLFASHGAQKVFGVFGGVNGAAVPLSSLFGVAGVIELVLGSLITVGLLGGYAAFVASGEMAVAYFIAHFPQGFWPLENKGEEAVLYCFAFLYMATQGSGIWSIDAARRAGSRGRAYRLT
jgi:putative oxidoreductase